MTINPLLDALKGEFDFTSADALPAEVVERILAELGLGSDFTEFYKNMNGLNYGWFKILPISNPDDIKRTWDSLEKANNANSSKFTVEEPFLDRFVVFAEIGAGKFAAYDKSDGSIWFESEQELHQTNLGLGKFI